MHLGVRRGACLPHELIAVVTFSNGSGSGKMFDSLECRLITVATFSDGSGSGKMFDSLECRLSIFQSSTSGPVLQVASRDFSIDSSSSTATITVVARLQTS